MAEPPPPPPDEIRKREYEGLRLVVKLRALGVPDSLLKPIIEFVRPSR